MRGYSSLLQKFNPWAFDERIAERSGGYRLNCFHTCASLPIGFSCTEGASLNNCTSKCFKCMYMFINTYTCVFVYVYVDACIEIVSIGTRYRYLYCLYVYCVYVYVLYKNMFKYIHTYTLMRIFRRLSISICMYKT